MDSKSLNLTVEKLAQLRALFPEVFSEDKVDFARLKEVLGENVAFPNEHYELSWAGKAEARREIQKQTTTTLIPDREGSVDFGETENIFIEGENLEVLRILQKSYFGKIKMIYIDPPYNTGNNSFVYPDDYAERLDEYNKRTGTTDEEGYLNKQDLWRKNTRDNGQFHSVWLSMMYPRLYLAKNLLSKDGAIFISIDDNEQANLRQMTNEIFGQENFLGCIVWKNATDNNPTNIAVEHEYLLVFARSKEYLESEWKSSLSDSKEKLIEIGKELINAHKDLKGLQAAYTVWFKQNKAFLGQLDRYKYIDFGGVYTGSQSVHNPGREGYRYDVIHPVTGKPCKQPLLGYRFPEDTMKQMLSEGKILFGEDETKIIEIKVYAEEFQDKLSSLIELDGRLGAYDLRGYFDDVINVFNNPKPVEFLKAIFSYVLKPNDIILDFFAGSGTTAHAILELNEDDGGNRNFICVQMPELLETTSNAYKAGYHTIAEICKARIQKVVEKLEANRAIELPLDAKSPLGFQSFKLASSNFKAWRGDVEGEELLKQLEIFRQSEKDGSAEENMLFELLLKSGLSLTAKVEAVKVGKQNVYFVEESKLLVFFATYNKMIKELIRKKSPKQVVCLDSAFKGKDEDLSNFKLELKEAGIELTVI